jgi:hypothetical protein
MKRQVWVVEQKRKVCIKYSPMLMNLYKCNAIAISNNLKRNYPDDDFRIVKYVPEVKR